MGFSIAEVETIWFERRPLVAETPLTYCPCEGVSGPYLGCCLSFGSSILISSDKSPALRLSTSYSLSLWFAFALE